MQSTPFNPVWLKAGFLRTFFATLLRHVRTGTPGILLLVSIRTCLCVTPQEALLQADELVRKNQFEQAEKQARLALADPAIAPVANAILGASRLEQKKFEESITFLQRAIRLEPRLLGARLNLAQAYSLLGETEQALTVYRDVLKFDPGNATARLAIGFAEAEKGDYKKSLETARGALAALKQNPDGLSLLATGFLKTGDRDSAASLASEWLKLRDVPVDWTVRFALLLANGGLTKEAAGLLEHAKQSAPQSYELDSALGGVWLLKGDLAPALENYEAAVALKPDSVIAVRRAAEIAEQRGELERSLSWWMHAKKLQPEDADVLFGLGRVCLRMDLLDDSEAALARAAELHPGDASVQYVLASARVGKKQFEAAERMLAGLSAKKPDDPQLHYALGAVFYLQSKLPEAETQFRESIRLEPKQLASWHYLGLVKRDEGNTEEAIRIFTELLRSHPTHAASYEALGILFISTGRYAEAERNLERAVALNPKSVKANYQLGLVLSRMGKKQESARQLELAKGLRQDDEATSRLQLRLLDPESITANVMGQRQ